MTLNLIETLKTSIYSPKHTKHMKIHSNILKNFKHFKNPHFQTFKGRTNQRSMLNFMASFIFYVECHTTLLVLLFWIIYIFRCLGSHAGVIWSLPDEQANPISSRPAPKGRKRDLRVFGEVKFLGWRVPLEHLKIEDPFTVRTHLQVIPTCRWAEGPSNVVL